MTSQIRSISVLPKHDRAPEALLLLRRIGKLVRPIMQAHNWILPKLVEFFPAQSNLLGVNCNMGEKICIRLRHANSPNEFYDLYTSLIPTMLHELTHNLHSAHDSTFFAQLEKLEEEFEVLRKSGYSGDGFDAPGTTLGRGLARTGALEGRANAVKTMEEKLRLGRLLKTGGRLGGVLLKGMTPKEVAADAAEARQRAIKSCGGHADVGSDPKARDKVQQEVDKAVRDGHVEVIDLTWEDDDDEPWLPVMPDEAKARDVKGHAKGAESEGELEIVELKGGISKRRKQDKVEILDDDLIIITPLVPSTSGSTRRDRNRNRKPISTPRPLAPVKASPARLPLVRAEEVRWECESSACASLSFLQRKEQCGNEKSMWSCRRCGEIKRSS